jgi:hypothetical protein
MPIAVNAEVGTQPRGAIVQRLALERGEYGCRGGGVDQEEHEEEATPAELEHGLEWRDIALVMVEQSERKEEHAERGQRQSAHEQRLVERDVEHAAQGEEVDKVELERSHEAQ